jgi:FAD/FMN-containing dehydrogenase
MTDIYAQLVEKLGEGVVLAPDSTLIARHTKDFSMTAPESAEIVALTFPHSTEEVSRILRFCHENDLAVVPQGGLTGLNGGAVPVTRCITLSLERMRKVEELDPYASTMTVEAGVVLETVQKLADEAGFMFPLDLGGRGSCQVGGNASTNAGGNRVLRYGMMRDLVLGVEAVLADGTVISSLSKVIKNNSGYDLRQFFIGSEGTLGVITRLVLRLYPKPRSVCTGLVALSDYPSVVEMLSVAKAGFGSTLTAFEVMWPEFYELGTVALERLPPIDAKHGCYVLIETMGTDAQADQTRFEAVIGGAIESGLVQDAVIAQSVRETQSLWAIRDCPGEWPKVYWPQLSFDVSVPTGEIGDLVEELNDKLQEKWPGIRRVFFGHVADGNLHLSVHKNGVDVSDHDIEAFVYATVETYRGSISAEHGIGMHKVEFLHHSRSPAEIEMMRTMKRALDPKGILNPGKII